MQSRTRRFELRTLFCYFEIQGYSYAPENRLDFLEHFFLLCNYEKMACHTESSVSDSDARQASPRASTAVREKVDGWLERGVHAGARRRVGSSESAIDSKIPTVAVIGARCTTSTAVTGGAVESTNAAAAAIGARRTTAATRV